MVELDSQYGFAGAPAAWLRQLTSFTPGPLTGPSYAHPVSSLVFVADDGPGAAATVKAALDQGGYQAAAFEDYVVAWHAFAFAPRQPRVLVVADKPANLSGRELIRLCRVINPAVGVILMRDEFSDLTCLSSGMVDAVLDKPFRQARLLQEVQRWCGAPADC